MRVTLYIVQYAIEEIFLVDISGNSETNASESESLLQIFQKIKIGDSPYIESIYRGCHPHMKEN